MANHIIERVPLNGTFELTARCNLKCKMCLIRIDQDRMAKLGGRERTTEEWIQIAGEVFEAGTIGLLLTGGEPMLRTDFIQIYKSIAQMGFMITLYTNATLVTSKIMDVLKKYPPHRIGITTYGASPETYKKVTGNSEAYYRMLEGVEQLKKLPSKLTIRTTLIKDNLEDLDKMAEWAMGLGNDIEFNVSRIVTKPVRGGIADVESCRLTPEENVAMLKKRNVEYFIRPLNKFIKDGHKTDKDSNILLENSLYKDDFQKEDNVLEEEDMKRTLYGCEAGMNSYTITWDGKLIGCQMLGDCWTYPYRDGFRKAWDEFPKQVVIPPLADQCKGCEVNCSACPALRLAETGSLGGLPEYICKDSRLANEMEEELITELQKIMNEKG